MSTTSPAGDQLRDEIERVVQRALQEDLALGPDVTTQATIDPAARGTADVVTRADGVVCGIEAAAATFAAVSEGRLECTAQVADGDRISAGQTLLSVTGPVADILTAERTALNLLTHLSGVATLTRTLVDAVEGTGARIRDSRKTLPGLRVLQKYAVRCGGGLNHRMALGDQALVKDNHIAAAGSLTAALRAVRSRAPQIEVEVEVDTLEQLDEALAAGARLILLDNMDADRMREAVRRARRHEGVRLEASGGLTPASVRAVAETGVDYLALGALTHSAPALDIGLDLRG